MGTPVALGRRGRQVEQRSTLAVRPIRIANAMPAHVGHAFLARHGAAGLAFDRHSQPWRAGLAVAHIAHVPDGRAAALSEIGPGFVVGQALEVAKQVHAPIEPDGLALVKTERFSPGRLLHHVSEDRLIRVDNLRRLCKARGWITDKSLGASELRNRLGRSYVFWRDLLNGDKSFGEKLARDIEGGLALPRGWLDNAEAAVPSEEGSSQPDLVYRSGSMTVATELKGPVRDIDIDVALSQSLHYLADALKRSDMVTRAGAAPLLGLLAQAPEEQERVIQALLSLIPLPSQTSASTEKAEPSAEERTQTPFPVPASVLKRTEKPGSRKVTNPSFYTDKNAELPAVQRAKKNISK